VDAGYFTLAQMRAHGKAGCYWLTAANAGTLLIEECGQCWDLVSFLRAQTGEEVDVQVYLGKRERLPVRLIAKRVSAEQAERRRTSANRLVEGKLKGVQRPNEKRRAAGDKRKRQRKRKKTGKARLQLLGWTILITNVPQQLLSIDEVLVLARFRWQIELLWKLWKQVGKVDTWRSAKPYRILTEIYAKLLGCLITHWLTLLECWQAPNRSIGKARQVVQWMTPLLALGIAGVVSLETMVQCTSSTMATGCTVNARRKRPAAYQLIANPKLIRGLG
jgi:Transposase DDE domain